ncbi:hypothetical protein DYB35_007699 [Aphanomyces astaci]|uniref:Retrovirus-related Pol polyprotein from transposon TNT 1-94-like beta-barrel domain-containing protein n=1 Tax=Aphanomyces astaci TaxID=112090 RepID=A0A3R6WEX8_APHAT|nr:hypothetical protein DYB35_007699 [Aphanomyces astaci]
MRYYLDSAYVPPTLKSDAYAKGKEALDYDRMMNPDTYSLDNYEDAGLAARKAIVAKAESDTLRTATTETLEEMLSMARANAVQYLLSSFAPSVRTAWDSYTSPSLLWTAILERHEVDNNVNDPTTLIAKINELKYSSSLGAHALFATLASLVKQCQRAMIPPDLASMTPQQVHDFYWEQFHSIYLCNAFVEESTIWKSLCKMQMQAKNAGKLCSLADLQRTIMEIIQVDLKHHQMLDQHGSADSTTRLQHLAAPAYPSSAPCISAIPLHALYGSIPHQSPLIKITSTIQCYLGLPKSHFQHCSHNRDTFTAPVVYDNHCFLNQAASQLYFLSPSAAVFVRASFSSSSLSEHKMNSSVGISWHIPSPSDNDSDEPLAPPPLGKAESSGDEDRAFEENEGSFYHPTVQHMQPLVAKAFRQHVYDKSNNYHITPIKPPKTHYRIRAPRAPWAQDNTRTSPQDTAEEFFDPAAPPVAKLADAWRAGLVPTHDHFAFHVGLVDSSFSLKVSYDESSAPTVYKSDSCPQLSHDWIIDSGATASCTPHKSYFRLSKFRSCSMTLTVGDGGQLPILGYGPVDLTVLSRNITKGPDHHSEPHFLSLPFGLYCPNLKFNLLSVRHAVSSGYQVKFDHPEHCLFTLDKTYYFRAAVNILGLYSFSATGVPPGSPLPPPQPSRRLLISLLTTKPSMRSQRRSRRPRL